MNPEQPDQKISEERLADYQKRAQEAHAIIQPILEAKNLKLSAQFNTDLWPGKLEPVVTYQDTKNWDEGIVSPIQASPKPATRAKARAKRKASKKK